MNSGKGESRKTRWTSACDVKNLHSGFVNLSPEGADIARPYLWAHRYFEKVQVAPKRVANRVAKFGAKTRVASKPKYSFTKFFTICISIGSFTTPRDCKTGVDLCICETL